MKSYQKYFFLWVILGAAVLAAGIFYLRGIRVEQEKFRIIYIPKVIDEKSDFWTLLIEGVEMAAAEYDVDLTVAGPSSEVDLARQNELIQWAVEQKPDALLLSAGSFTETAPYARLAVEAGIPLIMVDSAIDEDIADVFVATDNIELGRVEGDFMRQFAAEEAGIAVVGHVKNSSTAIEREAGVREGLGELEEQIVDVVFCDSDYDKAYALMVDLLKRYPEINLVAGLNEYSAVGAARAIKDLDLKEQVRVVGIDSSLEQIQLLEEGILEAIVIQNPFRMGYLSAEVAVKILRGEQVPKQIDSGCELITREDVYSEKNQKLLFPFREE